jgi:hypothetical protein
VHLDREFERHDRVLVPVDQEEGRVVRGHVQDRGGFDELLEFDGPLPPGVVPEAEERRGRIAPEIRRCSSRYHALHLRGFAVDRARIVRISVPVQHPEHADEVPSGRASHRPDVRGVDPVFVRVMPDEAHGA